MSERENIQERQYEKLGAYHRHRLEAFRVRYHVARKLLPTCLENVTCLDYGGGDAAMASMLTDEGADVIVFDRSKIALGLAQHADSRLRLVRGETLLPFHDGSFHIVTMLETLEHIPDSGEMIALNEARRVLDGQGLFVISVPSSKRAVSRKHYRHYSLDDIRKKLTSAGFMIVREVCTKELAPELSGRVFPIGKMIRGALYAADMIIRSVDGSMGLIECASQDADDFIVLARPAHYMFARLSRSELETTEMLDAAMAKAASAGFKSQPVKG